MAVITSAILLRSLAILHLTLAYYLLTDPSSLLTQSLVMILGGSMAISDPPASHFPSTPTASTSLAAVFLVYLALSDMISTGLADLAYDAHWGAQIPLRLMALFALETWIYLTGRGVDLQGLGHKITGTESIGDGVKNSVVFTWGFVELVTLFWVFLKVREERRDLAIRVKAEREKGQS